MNSKRAFTLVELMIVLLIIGVLVAIAIPRMIGNAHSAKVNCCKTNIDNMNRQIEMYYMNTDSWPNNLMKVTEDTTYFPDGAPVCPITGQKYPNTLVNNRVDASDHNH
jgi:prepilin-type N-terminal cleavage/methylation domain-containing protein